MPLVLRVELDASPALLALLERVLATLLPAGGAPPASAMPEPATEPDQGAADVLEPAMEQPPSVVPPSPPIQAERWSQDRIELLRRDYASGRPMPELLAALLALPGAPLTGAQVSSYAGNVLRVRRPAERPIETIRWTVERRELLRRDWPTARPRTDILLDLQALQGAPVTAKQMIDYARVQLQLARPVASEAAAKAVPEVALEAAAAPTPAPPAIVAPVPALPTPVAVQQPNQPREANPPAPGSLSPIPADYATIMAWAGQRGLASVRGGMDIPAVNRKRIDLGLPPFELRGRARAA